MPRVSEEYFEKKKQMIVDAAYSVCLRKPVEMVTMSDVIEEAGLSLGGIYRFYKDLDEGLCDMVTRMRLDYNFIDKFEKLKSIENPNINDMIYKFCDILGDTMEKHLMDIQKINFDLTVLAINEPKRAEKIIGSLKGRGTGNFEYLARTALPMLVKAAKQAGLKPRGKDKDIYNFISAAYTGIEMNCILSACYGSAIMNVTCKPKPLFKTLAKTIIYLIGGEEA